MAVEKFNWHGTNPNKAFQVKYPAVEVWPEMVLFNATKEETEAAYQALINHGRVCDFKTKVWNDICAKVYDLCDDWNINENYRTYALWNPFILEPDRTAWKELAKEKWPHMGEDKLNGWVDDIWKNYKPGVLRARNYNVVYSQWLAPLGLSAFSVEKGDPVKGEYILRLVELINHWTELTPLDVAFVMDLIWNSKGTGVVLRALPVFVEPNDMQFQILDNTEITKSIQIRFCNEMNLIMKAVKVPMLTSVAASSPMNFMTLNIQCKIWDKEIIYMVLEILQSVHGGRIRVVKSNPFLLEVAANFLYEQEIRAKLSSDLQAMHPIFFFEFGGRAKTNLSSPYLFGISDRFSYSGSAKVRRTARPIPFSAITGFLSETKARIDFEGIHMLDMTSGIIGIQEQIALDIRTVHALVHERSIALSDYKQGMIAANAATLTPEPESIDFQSKPQELINAKNVAGNHKGKIKIGQKIQLLNHPPEELLHTGKVQNINGGGEVTFANEETLNVCEGSFSVENGNIDLVFQNTRAMDHEGYLSTREQIGISQDPPLSIEGKEAAISSLSFGVLDKELVLEQAAEAAIETISYAEILTGFNKILEAEVVAARISSMAAMYTRRYFHLTSEEEVTSKEYGILEKYIRKLMESSNTTATKEKGELLLRLIRFASGQEIVQTASAAEAVRILPKYVVSMENTVITGLSAFLDASYVRGDSLISAPNISVVVDAEAGVSAAGSYLVSNETISAVYETNLQKNPSKALLGGEIAKTGADAKLIMARSEKIFAFEYENTLALELEERNALDVERRLIFS